MLGLLFAGLCCSKEHADYTGDQIISADAFVNISYKSTASWRYGGAATFTNGTTVSVVACVFSNCESNFGGAAAFDSVRSVVLSQLVVTGCRAENSGGAFDFKNCTQVVIDDCQFVSCSLDGEKGHYGGALFTTWDTLVENITIKNSAFENCSATDNGAAVYFGNVKTVKFDEVRFDRMKCQEGFLVLVSGDEANFVDVKVKECVGCIGCQAPAVFTRSVFAGGSTGVKAQGSLRLFSCDVREVTDAVVIAGDVAVDDCLFTDVVNQEPIIKCEEPTFHKVHAQKVRRGVQNTMIDNTKFVRCKISGNGVVYTQSPLKVSNCWFKQNVNGAVVCVNASSLEVRHTSFDENYGTNADAASALVIDGVSETLITGCDFHIKKETGANESVIRLAGSDSNAKISFERSYFTSSDIHVGDVHGLYINSTMKGQVSFSLPMCFDLNQRRSVYFAEGQSPAGNLNIFECVDCIPKKSHQLTNGQISGICAAASFGFIAIVLGIIWCVKRKKSGPYDQPLMEPSGQFDTYT